MGKYFRNYLAELPPRKKPLIFSSNNRMAVIDNHWKLLSLPGKNSPKLELCEESLSKDMAETTNLKDKEKNFRNLNKFINSSMISIQNSVIGMDYIEGKVAEQPPRIFLDRSKKTMKYFKDWKKRPEYKRLNNR